MSFHFELSASSSSSSSDEERHSFTVEEGSEEEKYEQTRDETEKNEFRLQYQLGVATATRNPQEVEETIRCTPNIAIYKDCHSSSNDEDISDWEEGIEEEEEEDCSAQEQKQSWSMGMAREITVHLFEPPREEEDVVATRNTRKRKPPRVRHKLTNLSPETTTLVRNIHQAHILTLTARAIHSFQQIWKLRECKLLAHIASSLIPIQFHIDQKPKYRHTVVPTYEQLQNFTQWYFTWIATLPQRLDNNRRRNISMGAPSLSNDELHQDRFSSTTNSSYHYYDHCNLCSSSNNVSSLHHRIRTILYYLASSCHDDDPTNSNTVVTITAKEKLYLYIYLCYSCLHWKAVRLVHSFSPMELDLTCNHPLLTVDMEAKHNNNYNCPTVQPVATAQPKSTAAFQRSWEKSINHYDTAPIDLTQDVSELKDLKKPAKRKKQNTMECHNQDDSLSESLVYLLLSHCLQNRNTMQSTRNDGSTIPSAKISSDVHTHGTYATGDPHAWVEVLCREENDTCPNLRWIPVDHEFEILNQPKRVEHILATLERKGRKNIPSTIAGGKPDGDTHNTNQSEGKSNKPPSRRRSRKKVSNGQYLRTQQLHQSPARKTCEISTKSKQLVSYVLAVEYRKPAEQKLNHSEDPSLKKRSVLSGIHLTDVTPRYASAWSKTLKLRGVTNRDLIRLVYRSDSSSYQSHSTLWWESLLQKFNRTFQPLNSSFGKKKSSSSRNSVPLSENEHNDDIIINELPIVTTPKDCNSSRKIPYNSNVAEIHEGTRDDDQLLQKNFLMEQKEFQEAAHKEAIPTSKNSFKNHPLYVIQSVLKELEVLMPDAKKHIIGMFKGEPVYKRCCVSPAYSEKKWLYERRKVRDAELSKPAKVVTPKRTIKRPKTFKALSTYGINNDDTDVQQISAPNGMEIFDETGKVRLYGIWQTDPWMPKYISLNDDIPRNEYGNIEKAMINPGLEHIKEPRMSRVAKKLGIPYVPCLVGFEGPLRAPSIQGIVVHHQNVTLLREAYVEFESHNVEKEYEKKQKLILLRWKRLIVGMQTKDRLEKEYGGCSKT